MRCPNITYWLQNASLKIPHRVQFPSIYDFKSHPVQKP
ncbi:hypothetical protein PspLS_06593 [Pyricularia sp. CBS 133598]|nr:hypothetical protein PspLS_06593 [Pyricularia sp. CBS 133598]